MNNDDPTPIPNESLNIMENNLQLNDNSKKKIVILWHLYLRANQATASIKLQNFLNTLQEYNNNLEMLDGAIDRKISDIRGGILNRIFINGGIGLKKRKTGKKRKRTNKKRRHTNSKKKINSKRGRTSRK